MNDLLSIMFIRLYEYYHGVYENYQVLSRRIFFICVGHVDISCMFRC